jgi:hypothetical protein
MTVSERSIDCWLANTCMRVTNEFISRTTGALTRQPIKSRNQAFNFHVTIVRLFNMNGQNGPPTVWCDTVLRSLESKENFPLCGRTSPLWKRESLLARFYLHSAVRRCPCHCIDSARKWMFYRGNWIILHDHVSSGGVSNRCFQDPSSCTRTTV